MSEALAVVSMPSVLPTGVTKRQWRLAALYPRCETAYEALIAAGYAHKTATKNAKSQLETVGVQRARRVQEEVKKRGLDKAHELHEKLADELEGRISSMKDEAAIVFYKATADVSAAAGPRDTTEASLPPSWYRGQRRRALLRAYALGMAAGRAAAGQQMDK